MRSGDPCDCGGIFAAAGFRRAGCFGTRYLACGVLLLMEMEFSIAELMRSITQVEVVS